MKKAVMSGCLPGGLSLPERFQLAAEAGFKGIEIALANEGFFSFEGDAADVRAVAKLSQDTGVAISGMLAGPMWETPPTSGDPAVRSKALRVVRRSQQVAEKLGVDTLLLVPGRVDAETP